jgi:DNA-3-methyladenine glycosylase
MNIQRYEKLDLTFYNRADVVQIAQDLLGKYLFTRINGVITGGKIVETEAYNGRTDKACHAYHKRTTRNEVMFAQGGCAYVYLCYGVHHLFNVVTNREGLADAILIRGLEPVIGLDVMKERRGKAKLNKISAGPGTLSQALGIRVGAFNGRSLLENDIWIAQKEADERFEMETDVRIGVDYAEEDALLPWRFYIKGNPYVSRIKKTLASN